MLGAPLGNPRPHVHVVGDAEDKLALPLVAPRRCQGHECEQLDDSDGPVLLGPRVAQHILQLAEERGG
eukprot:7869141-Pyramimonas_sp.AAC.1